MTSPSTSRHRHQHQVAPGATASHLQRAAWALCAGLAPLCLPAGTRAQQPVEAGPATAATAFAIPSRSAPEPSPPPGGQETLHGEALQLIAGRQHLLQAGVVPGRIAVGDPNVLDVKVLRSTSGGPSAAPELLLTPKAQGSTTLMVWPGKGGPPQTWQIQSGASTWRWSAAWPRCRSTRRSLQRCGKTRPHRPFCWTDRRSMSKAIRCRSMCRSWNSKRPP